VDIHPHPITSLKFQTQQRAPSASLVPSYAAAEVVLRREMEGLDTDFPEGGDIGILDQLFTLNRVPKARRHGAVEELVRTLSYRFRVQEEIFIIVESLMHLGLLSYQSLYLPIELSRGTSSIHTVVQSLECFDYVASTMSFLNGRGAFDTPATYVACDGYCPVLYGLDLDSRPISDDPASW